MADTPIEDDELIIGPRLASGWLILSISVIA